MGRNLGTDLSRPKVGVIRPSKLRPLEMITEVMACVSEFRRLSGIDLLAIAGQYTHCHSLSIEILFKTLIDLTKYCVIVQPKPYSFAKCS